MSTPERGGQRPRTEAERAAYYDTHHAEVEAWPEVPPPSGAKEAKQRGVIMSARFTMSEAAALERAARARGLTVSAFLRAAAQEAADVAPPPVDASRIADCGPPHRPRSGAAPQFPVASQSSWDH